jgi:hypothetical protein
MRGSRTELQDCRTVPILLLLSACTGGAGAHRSSPDAAVHAVCADDRCELTLAPCGSPAGIAVDAAHVYFTDCAGDARGSRVLSVPLGGGSARTLATGTSCPVDLALLGDRLFLAGLDGDAVTSVPITGGAKTEITRSSQRLTGLAVDTAGVDFTTEAGALIRTDLIGGSSTTLATCAQGCTAPRVHDSEVYWGDTGVGEIDKIPVTGGDPSSVTTGLDTVSAIAVADDEVYFAAGYLLMKAPLSGGPPITLATAAGAPVLTLATDDANVYFTSYDALWKVPRQGGDAVALASDATQPNAIAADATSVYWSSGLSPAQQPGGRCGRVVKLTPK